jgi:hypothetical protein
VSLDLFRLRDPRSLRGLVIPSTHPALRALSLEASLGERFSPSPSVHRRRTARSLPRSTRSARRARAADTPRISAPLGGAQGLEAICCSPLARARQQRPFFARVRGAKRRPRRNRAEAGRSRPREKRAAGNTRPSDLAPDRN